MTREAHEADYEWRRQMSGAPWAFDLAVLVDVAQANVRQGTLLHRQLEDLGLQLDGSLRRRTDVTKESCHLVLEVCWQAVMEHERRVLAQRWRREEEHHTRAAIEARDSYLLLRRHGHSGAEGARAVHESHEAQAAQCRRYAEQEEAAL